MKKATLYLSLFQLFASIIQPTVYVSAREAVESDQVVESEVVMPEPEPIVEEVPGVIESETEEELQPSIISSVEEADHTESMPDELEAISISEEEQNDETISEDMHVLNIFEPIDDNTLFIKGNAAKGVTVELLDGTGSIIQSVTSHNNGQFILALDTPFQAGTTLTVQSTYDDTILSQKTFTVEKRGLQLNNLIYNTSSEISGTTSPSKSVQLLNVQNVILDTVTSDQKGNFKFTLTEPLTTDSEVIVQVLDENVLARSVNVSVEEHPERKLKEPIIYDDITDQMTTIHGIADPNVTINMINENSKILATVKSDAEGMFIFELTKPFKADTTLKFQSQNDQANSSVLVMKVTEREVKEKTKMMPISTFSKKGYPSFQTSNLVTVEIDEDTTDINGTVDMEQLDDEIDNIVEFIFGLFTSKSFTIEMRDDKGRFYDSDSISENGTFNLNLHSPLKANTTVIFTIKVEPYLLFIPLGSEIVGMDTVVVQGNRLELAQGLDNIVFNTTQITNEGNQIIGRQSSENYVINVLNTKNTNWNLTASADSLSSANGHVLLGGLVYSTGNGDYTSITNNPVYVTHRSDSQEHRNNIETVKWASDEGILLETNPFYAMPNTEYSTTITWTLSDAP